MKHGLSVAKEKDDVQPMKQAGTGIVSLMLMWKIFQCREVTAVTIVADHAAFCKGRSGKFSDGSLLDIGSDLHFEIAWFPYLTGADDRHQLFKVGDLARIGGLVSQHPHMMGQAAPVYVVRPFAQ